MSNSHSKKGGGVFFGFITIVVAMLLMLGPLFFGGLVHMSGTAQVVLALFGLVIFIIGASIIIISRLYVRTSADESFVRTGQGGQKAVVDGGALVIPVIHEIMFVSHATMKLVVERTGHNALITGDHLRADATAEFYIRVPKDDNNVIAAAASLGVKGMDPERLKELVFEKLENALRAVAGTKKLMELHSDRQGFVEAVAETVSKALEANGLKLEEATLSKLDQAPTDDLNPNDNVFDAKGAIIVSEITAKARVERTKLETKADQDVKDQEVSTQKAILARDVELAEEQATTNRKKAEATARGEAEARMVEEQQQQEAELAGVTRRKTVEVAEVDRQQTLDVAEQNRQKAQQTAEISKKQAVEVADADKKIAVENRHKDLADAEADRQEAEAGAEEQRQAVKTVTVTATAERDAKKVVIDEKGKVDKEAYRDRTKAEVTAFEVTTKADGDKTAAERNAEATILEADAGRDAAKATAEGEQAAAMIPVEVERERVAVRAADVEVTGKELKLKAEFQEISKELEIVLAQIAAGENVDIKRAEAMGESLSKVNMTLWGDPDTFNSMTSAFLGGQRVGKMAEGLLAGAPEKITNLAEDALRGMGGSLSTMLKKFTGADVSEEALQEVSA